MMWHSYMCSINQVRCQETITTYMDVSDNFGLTVSILKTKLTVSGYGIEEDKKPITIRDSEIEHVENFS